MKTLGVAAAAALVAHAPFSLARSSLVDVSTQGALNGKFIPEQRTNSANFIESTSQAQVASATVFANAWGQFGSMRAEALVAKTPTQSGGQGPLLAKARAGFADSITVTSAGHTGETHEMIVTYTIDASLAFAPPASAGAYVAADCSVSLGGTSGQSGFWSFARVRPFLGSWETVETGANFSGTYNLHVVMSVGQTLQLFANVGAEASAGFLLPSQAMSALARVGGSGNLPQDSPMMGFTWGGIRIPTLGEFEIVSESGTNYQSPIPTPSTAATLAVVGMSVVRRRR